MGALLLRIIGVFDTHLLVLVDGLFKLQDHLAYSWKIKRFLVGLFKQHKKGSMVSVMLGGVLVVLVLPGS